MQPATKVVDDAVSTFLYESLLNCIDTFWLCGQNPGVDGNIGRAYLQFPVDARSSKVYAVITEYLYKERGRQKISQRNLAKKAGVSRATLQNLEDGEGEVRMTTLFKVAEALGLQFSELVRKTEKSL